MELKQKLYKPYLRNRRGQKEETKGRSEQERPGKGDKK